MTVFVMIPKKEMAKLQLCLKVMLLSHKTSPERYRKAISVNCGNC